MGLVLLVRHGQASFGADDYDVLSETGWDQGRALGRHLALAGVAPTAVVRGTMRRHRETLEAVIEAAGWDPPAVDVDPGWDEFDHVGLVAAYPDLPEGDLDRRGFQEVFTRATARWTSGEGEGYPETYVEFVGRVRGALARVGAAAGRGQVVLVVTSGGPVGVVAATLVDPDDEDAAALARRWTSFNTVGVNSGLTRVVVGPTGARLLTFNEHSHLDPDRTTYR